MTTILDICGINRKNSADSAGSLTPLLGLSPEAYQFQPIIAVHVGETHRLLRSVIIDGMKYIATKKSERLQEELYDLARDPEEQISIFTSFPDKVQEARNILREHEQMSKKLREHYNAVEREEISLDKETVRELKALGYLQ